MRNNTEIVVCSVGSNTGAVVGAAIGSGIIARVVAEVNEHKDSPGEGISKPDEWLMSFGIGSAGKGTWGTAKQSDPTEKTKTKFLACTEDLKDFQYQSQYPALMLKPEEEVSELDQRILRLCLSLELL